MTEIATELQQAVKIEWDGEAIKAAIELPGIGSLRCQKHGKQSWYVQTLDLAGVPEGQDPIVEFWDALIGSGYPLLVDSDLCRALEATLDATAFTPEQCDCPDHTCSSVREHAELVHACLQAAAMPDYLF